MVKVLDDQIQLKNIMSPHDSLMENKSIQSNFKNEKQNFSGILDNKQIDDKQGVNNCKSIYDNSTRYSFETSLTQGLLKEYHRNFAKSIMNLFSRITDFSQCYSCMSIQKTKFKYDFRLHTLNLRQLNKTYANTKLNISKNKSKELNNSINSNIDNKYSIKKECNGRQSTDKKTVNSRNKNKNMLDISYQDTSNVNKNIDLNNSVRKHLTFEKNISIFHDEEYFNNKKENSIFINNSLKIDNQEPIYGKAINSHLKISKISLVPSSIIDKRNNKSSTFRIQNSNLVNLNSKISEKKQKNYSRNVDSDELKPKSTFQNNTRKNLEERIKNIDFKLSNMHNTHVNNHSYVSEVNNNN